MSKKRIYPALALVLAGSLALAYICLPGRITDRILYRAGLAPAWKSSRLETAGNGFYGKRTELSLLSPVFHIDRIYRSMTGPRAKFNNACFDRFGQPTLLWLTDYSVEVTDDKGEQILSPDFMCHNNLDFPIGKYLDQFHLSGDKDAFNSRFATLSEGQTRISFPEGFAVPFYSTDSVLIWAQALNHNLSPVALDVRHRIKLGYVADADLKKPLKPLFKRTVYIELPVAGEGKQPEHGDCDMKDCSPAKASEKDITTSADGRRYSSHWNIPDGRDTFRCKVTQWMHLTENTLLHYANVHLHPYAISLTLRDITEGKDVFTSYVENYKDRTGMEKIGHYSSTEGTPLYKDHEYELVCITDNTSHKEQDMMAVMILYVQEPELERNISAIRAFRPAGTGRISKAGR